MSRPGLVLEVDERTPALVVHEGEGFRLESFPLGTRVIYPPDPLPGIRDVNAAIREALLHPVDSEPLPALLRPGMRLTIAFDDLSLPLPPMRKPDIRQRVIEAVLTMAAEAGVDDVELVAANALHRRMTPAELRGIVGERVFRSFHPDGLLTNFDAEDRARLAHLGLTDRGEDVEIHRRSAESDLLVYVNVNLVAMDGGWKSTAVGLASYRSLRHHHNTQTMVASRSFMDHTASALHASAWRMGQVLRQHVRVFQIETTLNNDVFAAPFHFLQRREWEWSLRDQAAMLTARRALTLAPAGARRRVFSSLEAAYGVTGVTAGEVAAVHERTLAAVHRQQLVEVDGQSDVLVLGLPYLSPYNVNSVMNPVLACCLGLGYFFNSYRGRPLVRAGGAVILYHPVPWEFHQLHHPSYVDFFEEVLAESTDPATIEAKFEERYATDPWYVHLYRTSYAYHGVHPFYMWYWAAHALDHLGDVVWVGADRRAVGRMGFRAASTLRDALEMVSGSVGRDPSISYLHAPPHILADVR
ncbi:MAG TPA: lactate racemase domain-containing protein [Mycobacteriales bacterium]|nr:lactate racemase domain-containing protein [Mycobacteriales bacterium]